MRSPAGGEIGEAPPVADEASRFRGSAPIGGHDSARQSVGTTVGKRAPPLRTIKNPLHRADRVVRPYNPIRRGRCRHRPLRRARGKMKKYAIRGRKLLTNGREHGIIIFVLARLAQLVEHMLDVHGVTGSSPVPRTIVKSPGISKIPGLFVILPKCASFGFGQMPPEASKIAFSPGPAKAV